jgi:anthranilate phosphoribosyltransferase
MKYVAPVRRELGIRTIFNILGPLVNPAGANMELLGVYEEAMVKQMAQVLANLGVKNAFVVYGQDGLDEISMSAPTSICEVRNATLNFFEITPEQFGFKRCDKSELVGGSPQENAFITREILSNRGGSKKDAVILNSAAAIHVAKPEIKLQEAVEIAKETIISGKALKQLEKFAEYSNDSQQNC